MKYICIGKILVKKLTSLKLSHCFFRGKNRIQKIREKSGSEISGTFDQILVTVYKNGQIFEEQRFFLEIFTNFDVFEIAISPSKNITMLKSF